MESSTHLNKFKKRFILSMVFIGIILISITAIEYHVISRETSLLTVVNKSGQQRMLSQKILLLTDRLSNETSPENRTLYLETLQGTIDQMESNHTLLITGSAQGITPKLSHELRDFYFGDAVHLDRKVRQFLENANQFISLANANEGNTAELKRLYQDINAVAFKDLPNDLDHATNLFEKAGRKSIYNLKLLEPLLILTTVFSLFVIWYYIFRPLYALLLTTVRNLEHERDKSEAEKKRYELAVQGTSIGVWDWDIEERTFHWDGVLKDILGITEQNKHSFTLDYFQDLLHPDDKDGFNTAIYTHLKNASVFYFEGRLRHANNHYLWVKFRGQAQWAENSRAYRMVGSIEDITEKREAEMQKNIFIQGIENSGLPFAILEINNNNSFSYATQTFCDLSGHTIESLLGKNLNIFTGPETTMSDLDSIDSALKQRKGIKIKIVSYRKDGTSFWNEITAEPIPNEYDNNNIYYAIIFNDLTESILREKMEIQRQRNESLGALAASVAHEINNLLMPMAMAKDVLENELKDDCDPFAHEQIDTIVNYAHQAKEIVNGILIFSRKETQNLESVVIYDLLKSSVSFIGGLLNANTSIVITPPANKDIETISCYINTIEFRQVITNLAKNSEHAFDGDKGEITISLSSVTLSNAEKMNLQVRDSQHILIHFTDNGTGIPNDIIPKIFDPLFTTKAVGMGTGLGLSVVHGILQSWGGAITVESTKGVGTKFNIYIPVLTDENDFDYLSDLLDDA